MLFWSFPIKSRAIDFSFLEPLRFSTYGPSKKNIVGPEKRQFQKGALHLDHETNPYNSIFKRQRAQLQMDKVNRFFFQNRAGD